MRFLQKLYDTYELSYDQDLGARHCVNIPQLLEDGILEIEDGDTVHITEFGLALFESFNTKMALKEKNLDFGAPVVLHSIHDDPRLKGVLVSRLHHGEYPIPGEFVLILVDGEDYLRTAQVKYLERD